MFYSNLHRRSMVSAALLLATSCSDAPTGASPPSSLDRVESTAAVQAGYVARGDILQRNVFLADDQSVSATISPDGGFLVLPEAGLLMLFPRGAVAQPTLITATALKGRGIVYDFQPHGLSFLRPIYVAQLLIDTEVNAPRSVKRTLPLWGGYLVNGSNDIAADGSAGFTEVFPVFFQGKGSDRLAVFTTRHFSQYAMASGLRGAPVEVVGVQ